MARNFTTRIVQRWQMLTAAPHRMFFATGLVWLLAWSAWWLLVLGGRAAGSAALEPAIPALLQHGATMLFLVLPPFMYGFLLTVFPRWMPAPQPARSAMLAALVLLNAGNLLAFAGAMFHSAFAAGGWLLATLALAIVAASLLSILRRARQRASHAYAVLTGLMAGLAGMALVTWMLASGAFQAWPLARGLGLWGFLLVVYFGVCHRMIPFFSSRVIAGYVAWRPDWLLYLFVGLAFGRGLLELIPGLAWIASVPLAGIALACVFRWHPRQRTGARLLDVLHIALGWLATGLVLAAASDLAAALDAPGLFGRGALHALGMGFFGGMLMAMVTRVTLGHSGRPLTLDMFSWRLFLLVQTATMLRIAGDFLPPAAGWLALAAASLWLAAFGAWGARQLPVYFRPRADGAPG
jgi:uncharacterized protein involved in response to NO